MTKHVVIVGAGYGGMTALSELLHYDFISITLIDQHPYHYLQTEVYDFIANRTTMADITLSLVTLQATFSERVRFIQSKLTALDSSKKTITLNNHDEIAYDDLILALGSRTFYPEAIEGIHTHTHGFKNLAGAFLFKQEFERLMHEKIEKEGQCSLGGEFKVVVCGAGLSGVEIASAMSEYSKEFFERSAYVCGAVNVTLIASGKEVLEGMDSYLQKVTTQRLRALGITIMYGKRVIRFEKDRVFFNDGSSLSMNFAIWAGGVIASSTVSQLGLSCNQKHQICVDEYLSFAPHAYAIGDCAEHRNRDNHIIPPTAQLAEEGAKYVAHKIAKTLLTPFHFVSQGVLIALGGRYGVGVLKGLKVKGFMAYLLKWGVSQWYRKTLLQKCLKGKRSIP